MKNVLLINWWLLSVGLLNSDEPQPRHQFAKLIIYRQKEFNGTVYDLKINDRNVGSLPRNRFVEVNIPPGRTKIESVKDYFSDNQLIWINAQPDRTYYVKAVEDVDFLTRTLLLAPVGDEQARQELRRVKPADGAAPAQKD